ncbi:MAG: 2-oxo acid dehydrogenase subunit E2 [Spirochaetes bacterium]|nr:2-oxo acid dehydrogenase subunit E2 [Spirochaetota bacterium]
MAREFLLPQLGQSVESCIIIEWRKKEGDYVKEGDILCEVETDKTALEVESTEEGTLVKILHPEGDDVPVLHPIALIGSKDELGSQDTTETTSRRKIKISPRARRLAEKNGIDLKRLKDYSGTGPGGRIIECDIKQYLKAGISTGPVKAAEISEEYPPEEYPGEPQETEKPLRGIRKLTAEKMLKSIQNSAQYTLTASADARKILAYRKRLKNAEEQPVLSSITINDIVLFAAVKTLVKYTNINSLLTDGKITERKSVDLGFAVDTPGGLIVPVIRNAEKLSLLELASEAKRLRDACRNGTIRPDEYAGGTFTVTNLGSLNIETFTPILNPPQAGILGVCSILPKPVFADKTVSDTYEVRFIPALQLSLTLDHRVIDGAPGARFLSALCKAIENFDLLLAG